MSVKIRKWIDRVVDAKKALHELTAEDIPDVSIVDTTWRICNVCDGIERMARAVKKDASIGIEHGNVFYTFDYRGIKFIQYRRG